MVVRMRRLYATALFKALVEFGWDEEEAFDLCAGLISRSYDEKRDIEELARDVVGDEEILRHARTYYAVGLQRTRRIRYWGYLSVAGLILLAGFFASFLPRQYVGLVFLVAILLAPIVVFLITRRMLGVMDVGK